LAILSMESGGGGLQAAIRAAQASSVACLTWRNVGRIRGLQFGVVVPAV
jgi:hypothetical protein